jgi:hypothetical protein
VVSLPTIESSFALHTTRSISGFDHPDAAALRLACEVLDGAESFLWVGCGALRTFISCADVGILLCLQKFIRGAGLAYGANLTPDLESGLLSLQLYRVRNGLVSPEANSDQRGCLFSALTVTWHIMKRPRWSEG